jgi:hypothetical protein
MASMECAVASTSVTSASDAGHGLIHHLTRLVGQLLALAGQLGSIGRALRYRDGGTAHLVDGGDHLFGLPHMLRQQALG